MTKDEFIAALANHSGLSKRDATLALYGFKLAMTEALRSSNRLALPGIGVFTVAERAARKGRNPATGAEIEIPAKKSIKFKAANDLQGVVCND